MSRRASLIQKQNPECVKKCVHFPTELVFLESLKDNDLDQAAGMLRRASLRIDINAIADSGLTPLHQAVINENYSAVRLLLSHGADVNARDEDSWTPLHAAAAVGSCDIIKMLLSHGADPIAMTVFDERPIDLCDSDDIGAISLLLEALKKEKANSSMKIGSKKPAMVKSGSLSPKPSRSAPSSTNNKKPPSGQNNIRSSGSNYTIKSSSSRSNTGVSKLYNLFSSSKSDSSSSTNDVNKLKLTTKSDESKRK